MLSGSRVSAAIEPSNRKPIPICGAKGIATIEALLQPYSRGAIDDPAEAFDALRPEVAASSAAVHAVSKVTRGRRYEFLPFLYDDAAAQL